MIANERQYRITKAWVEKFEHGAAHGEEAAAGLDPLLQQAMRDQYEGQAQELRAQLDDYDALRAGRIATVPLRSLSDLPAALIKARIASGLTHKQLAERLHVTEQQVQRDEARHYKGVSLERVLAVAETLGVQTRGTIVLPHPTARPRRQVAPSPRRRGSPSPTTRQKAPIP